eukprot:TRINITY_DN19089_c0_g1_i2.p1 TRINITY_DN19089_c0_g1~~TRINITY_DN19089_c0_g1_i2.p1  ORF type:complete len:523 (-),score=110.66 TRINITY_DN19089_c0_g1_i2:218-1786(-)
MMETPTPLEETAQETEHVEIDLAPRHVAESKSPAAEVEAESGGARHGAAGEADVERKIKPGREEQSAELQQDGRAVQEAERGNVQSGSHQPETALEALSSLSVSESQLAAGAGAANSEITEVPVSQAAREMAPKAASEHMSFKDSDEPKCLVENQLLTVGVQAETNGATVEAVVEDKASGCAVEAVTQPQPAEATDNHEVVKVQNAVSQSAQAQPEQPQAAVEATSATDEYDPPAKADVAAAARETEECSELEATELDPLVEVTRHPRGGESEAQLKCSEIKQDLVDSREAPCNNTTSQSGGKFEFDPSSRCSITSAVASNDAIILPADSGMASSSDLECQSTCSTATSMNWERYNEVKSVFEEVLDEEERLSSESSRQLNEFESRLDRILAPVQQAARSVGDRIEQGIGYLNDKSSSLDRSVSSSAQRGEDFVMERSKAARESFLRGLQGVRSSASALSRSGPVQHASQVAQARDRVDSARDRVEDVVSAAVGQAQSTSAKVIGKVGYIRKSLTKSLFQRS